MKTQIINRNISSYKAQDKWNTWIGFKSECFFYFCFFKFLSIWVFIGYFEVFYNNLDTAISNINLPGVAWKSAKTVNNFQLSVPHAHPPRMPSQKRWLLILATWSKKHANII